jgi:hypothetical protein
MPSEPSPRDPHLQHLDWIDEVWELQPSGLRVEALREVGRTLRQKLHQGERAAAVRTCDLLDFPYPRAYAFWQVEMLPVPFVMLRHRMMVVQFYQEGVLKTLLFNPTEPERATSIPWYDRLRRRVGPFVAARFRRQHATPADHLRLLGIRREQIDYVAFDHFHGQDLRLLLGTEGKEGEVKLEPLYPNARFLVQKRELVALRAPHPLQRPWLIPDAVKGIRHGQLELLIGSYLLGDGVALLRTPGHTAGSQSLVLNTPRGIFVISENGVAPDCYDPLRSSMRGLGRFAREREQECVLNGNIFELPHDQYSSMVLERSVADACLEDERFGNVYSSSVFLPSYLSPGLRPFVHRALSYGDIVGARQEAREKSEVAPGLMPLVTL